MEQDVTALSDHNLMKIAMASCHTLTMIQDELCGDPLDLKMFQATKWVCNKAALKKNVRFLSKN